MRKVPVRLWALLAVFGAMLLWNCRGKEGPQGPAGPQGPVGPQGPAGQDLTRIREGYIRGTVKGRDTIRNQNFQLDFDYTYIPVWSGYPGYSMPESGQPDTIEISLSREGEMVGSLSIDLRHRRSNNTTWVSSLYGNILAISGSTASEYNVSYNALFSTDTAYVTNINLSGDTLITGRLTYIKRTKSIPDTLVADFSSRLLRVIYYQRQARPSSGISQNHSE